jgi:ketol-acid reductoisomerase
MRRRNSTTARFGDLSRGPRVIGEPARTAMREILAEIRDGRFARELLSMKGGALSGSTDGMERTGVTIRSLFDDSPDFSA